MRAARGGGGFGRELGVISVTVETGAGFVEDIAEGKKVKDKEEILQDRALGGTWGRRSKIKRRFSRTAPWRAPELTAEG